MKLGILYDSTEPESRALFEGAVAVAEKSGAKTSIIDVSKADSAPCICCFQCWMKTPGLCILPRDGGTQYVERFWDAECLLIISRVQWGGYTARIKSYIDRLIPGLHPYFTKRNGEMHHKFRYDSIPLMLAAGYGARSAGEEETFRAYTTSNRDHRGITRDSATFIVAKEAERNPRAAEECALWLEAELRDIGKEARK